MTLVRTIEQEGSSKARAKLGRKGFRKTKGGLPKSVVYAYIYREREKERGRTRELCIFICESCFGCAQSKAKESKVKVRVRVSKEQ